MYWMFSGYLAAFVLALATDAALTIGSPPKPMAGLAAYFFFIPMMIGALGAEVMIAVSDEHKARVRRAILEGWLSRRYVFWCGLLGGVVVMSLVWAVGIVLNSSAIVFMAIFAVALGPLGPAVWVIRKARKRLDFE